MFRKTPQARACPVLLAALALVAPAHAIQPAEGFYWSPSRPGEGLQLEQQGNVVAITIYSFQRDGTPVFFTAAGTLTEGGSIEPTPFTEGLFPLHSVTAPLYRYTGGPLFGHGHVRETLPGGTAHEPVGTIRFTSAFHGSLMYEIGFNDPDPDLPSAGGGVAIRFLYGFEGIGQNQITDAACLADLQGEWIFYSEQDKSFLERFDFGPPVVEGDADDCPGNSPLTVEYQDAGARALMRCVRSEVSDPDFGRQVVVGCELRRDETALLWFSVHDIGITSIVASPGAIPTPTPTYHPLRASQRILGTRLK